MRNSELIAQLAEECSDEVLDKHIRSCESHDCYCRVDRDQIRATIERTLLRLAADLRNKE